MTAPTLAASGSGNFLVSPNVGVMLWTLVAFGITVVLLSRLVFPRISEALAKRQKEIEDSIDSAQRTRDEAETLLAEYRQRLAEARSQSDEIVQRARQAAETHERESKEHAKELAAEASARAARDIEAATQRAMQELRQEVADLTVMATEKVTRKVLDDADQRRMVDEALGELDFSGISGSGEE
ncbi:MAG TPA: F0F1 ATP synthase subunit B [Solirubrobacteraceae bacterium]|jgi:F-type H+-transporting ATPase subunit b|nr:F0F1 ATP synthase subunit B [Solirubrobacteraceae bacterium]